MSLLVDSGDFAQVPFSQESLAPVQDDWIGQMQVLDLPQLFSFKDSSSDFSSEELDEFSKGVDISTLESLLDVVPPTSQHDAPGPSRSPSSIKQQKGSPITPPQTPAKGISIARDDLLKFSSDDLEAYVKALSATRTLTAGEQKEIKRQRRLIKNRESAQQSRKRKKDKVGDLEGLVAQLEAVNEERKARLEEIQAEHVILKAEVSQLVNVIKDSPALSSLLMNVASWMVMYTLKEAAKIQNVQQTIIPPLIQQKMQQQFPASRAIC